MAATKSRKPGPGRPRGRPNKLTEALGGRLDQARARATRDILRAVIANTVDEELREAHAADLAVATALWTCALKAVRDHRYLSALHAIEVRLWGRPKFELEHSGTEGPIPIRIIRETRPAPPAPRGARPDDSADGV